MTIRYHNGVVAWRERNHYFFEWGQHNVENKICRADRHGRRGRAATRRSTGTRELGSGAFCDDRHPARLVLANKQLLANGDIIGFVTRGRTWIISTSALSPSGANGELLLRHASESRHRVLDERMDRFFAVNRVRYVTLLRPEEPAAGPLAVKKDG